ncbi:MAG: 23S rRNA (adenine(2030)-N(6))-methyltransferase RlmJ [Patescibacteria group bacterium]|jgi:16S rRNA (guanine966-N2)-methyltransferase|nr:23S rRNA (adenine(2030)-N(6))-methyltransferase RlmJ [Patescibacteria group bacterium]
MRIIAGYLKGRQIESPKKYATHPMSEKIRGALFNVLGDINGLEMLDAYAGSGAIGIEAISRGAKYVVACDIDTSAFRILEKNINQLDLKEKIKAVHANCTVFIDTNPRRYDIVICDPPYNNVKPSQLIALSGAVKKGGLLVLSLPPTHKITSDSFVGFKYIQSKSYGDATLWFYRKT